MDRLGVAIDHALLYVKAGGAEAHFNHDVATGIVGIGFTGPSYSLGENRGGVTAGAGFEYTFWGNWSAKVEYDFMDFRTKNLTFIPLANVTFGRTLNALTQFADDRERVHVIKAGLNYRFWWGTAPTPVVARY